MVKRTTSEESNQGRRQWQIQPTPFHSHLLFGAQINRVCLLTHHSGKGWRRSSDSTKYHSYILLRLVTIKWSSAEQRDFSKIIYERLIPLIETAIGK